MPKAKKNESNPGFLTGPQRLNKILAAAGLGSRRQVEELIEQERVEIDGEVCAEFHRKVDPAVSKISVDGVSLRKQRPVYFAVNKPAGVLCTNRDPEGRPRVIDLVPASARLFPVGRLDSSSLGLILLTNDGELAQRLAHPRYSVPKSYFVVVQGQIGYEELARLRRGIYLAEGVARVEGAKIRKVRKGCTELDITLTEGKNREIRRVLARLGHKVVVLRRVAIGPLRLADLPEGAHRPLHSSEVAALYRAAEEARIAKKGKRSAEEDHEERPAEKKKQRATPDRIKADSKQDLSSKKPKKPKSNPKRSASLDDDELLVDRFDEDDDYETNPLPFDPSLDDPDSFESPDRSFDDIPPMIDPERLIEISPKWQGDDSLPIGRARGGVIDYEEPVEGRGSKREKPVRDENNKILSPRTKGNVRGKDTRPTRSSRSKFMGQRDESVRDAARPARDGERPSRPRKGAKGARGASFGKRAFKGKPEGARNDRAGTSGEPREGARKGGFKKGSFRKGVKKGPPREGNFQSSAKGVSPRKGGPGKGGPRQGAPRKGIKKSGFKKGGPASRGGASGKRKRER